MNFRTCHTGKGSIVKGDFFVVKANMKNVENIVEKGGGKGVLLDQKAQKKYSLSRKYRIRG